MATTVTATSKPFRINKFVIGGGLLIIAVALLIITSVQGNSQYFLTVKELQDKSSQMVGRDVRVSGAVLGDTIVYDAQTLTLSFTVANIPGDNKEIDRLGGMAAVLHQATLDPTLARLKVVYYGVKPDLMKNEAQAIMTGKLGADGVFKAGELLLKCPSRYEDAAPTAQPTP
jgi:cytochrome c-type biogenesis protein CcmE